MKTICLDREECGYFILLDEETESFDICPECGMPAITVEDDYQPIIFRGNDEDIDDLLISTLNSLKVSK